jgi:hypothetical protein
MSSHVDVQPALERLGALASLEPEWDTYGGAPPTDIAIEVARNAIGTVAERFGAVAGEASVPYDVAPISNGGVGVEWRRGTTSFELWIGPTGTRGYLHVDGAGASRHTEEADDVRDADVLRILGDILVG